MSLDELTDDEFFKFYNGSPEIKKLVDGIQMKYHAHSSQKGQPGYDPGNMAWYEEAKSAVSGLVGKQEHKLETPSHKAHGPAHTTTAMSTTTKSLMGLAAVVTLILAASGLPAMPYMPPPLY